MNYIFKLIPALAILSACASTPEIETTEIIIPPIEQGCYPVDILKKVVVPAVTKSGFYITSIENPPEYIYDEATGKTTIIQNPPIERKEPYTKIVTPEQIYYTTESGEKVNNICELKEEVAPDPAG